MFPHLEAAVAANLPLLAVALQSVTPVRTGALRDSITLRADGFTFILDLNYYYQFLEHRYGYVTRVNSVLNLTPLSNSESLNSAISDMVAKLEEALVQDIQSY